MSVQDNIAEVKFALEAVKNHCMCAKFQEDKTHYLVIFPPGDWPVDGIRVANGMGKVKALQVMIDKMEKFWLESFI